MKKMFKHESLRIGQIAIFTHIKIILETEDMDTII